MFRVIKLMEGMYRVRTDFGKPLDVTCTQAEALTILLQIGISSAEVERGFVELFRREHDVIEFGINHTLTITRKLTLEDLDDDFPKIKYH